MLLKFRQSLSNKTFRGQLAIVIAAIIWALAAPVQKLALRDFTPFALLFWRFVLASVLFSLYYFSRKKLSYNIKSLIKLFSIASLIPLGVLFYVYGINSTTISSAQAITLGVPITTTIGSIFLLKEKISKIQLVGFVIGLIGLTLIILQPIFKGNTDYRFGNTTGNKMVIISALLTAGYFIGSRYLSKEFDSLTLTFSTLLSGAVLFSILGFIEVIRGNSIIPQSFTITNFFEILYLVIFGSILNFFLYQ